MGYLVLVQAPGVAASTFDAMVADLVQRQGWRQALKAYALAVLVKGPAAPAVHALEGRQGVGGVLLGEVFDRGAADQGEARRADLAGLIDLDPLDAAARLINGAWGGYVAVLARRRGDPPTILRDPTGQVEAFIWRRDGVTLIGSEAPFGPAAPVDLEIDWPRLAAILDDPRRSGGAPPLKGIIGVDPGECRHGPGARQTQRPWSPGRFAREEATPPDLVAALRRRVDVGVAAAALDRQTLLCEISGGLDSAIVASSLAVAGRPPRGAINFYRDQAEGDERVWANAVAEAIGAPLKAVRRTPFALDQDAFTFGAASIRPSLNALDPDYDRLLLAEIDRLGADALVTGHGGDVVFYQVGAAEIASDLLLGKSCDGHRLKRLGDIARRTRRSVWSLASQTVFGRGLGDRRQNDGRFIVPAAKGSAHPWLDEARGVSPAKQVQLAGLVNSLNVVARTRRGEATRLAHPLLSQPLVELCLAIPAPILCAGEGDRSLARRAFADRLPPMVAERRSKGDITVFFGRSLAASLTVLRPMLLEGRLVAQGLIDREALEAALQPEALVWRDHYGEILVAAALEAWVAHWEGRIASGGAPPIAARALKAVSRKAKARE